MRREAILTYLNAPLEAALHHIPTKRPLKPAEDEETAELRRQTPGDAATPEEPQEWHQKHQPDQPPPEPMHVFPHKDRLERAERHVGVYGAVLRDRLIAREFALPLGVAQRRN